MDSELSVIEKLERSMEFDKDRPMKAGALRALYETLAEHLYHQYEPTRGSSNARLSRDFIVRLNEWLKCFRSEEDQWIAFKSIEYFFFAGQSEFDELYRCAFDHVIKPWIIDENNIDIFSAESTGILNQELAKIWPCPISDSLRINSFLHLTGLKGQSLRPDWMSLNSLGDPGKIKDFCDKENLKYLVLIEDFIGSGGQAARLLNFALSVFNGPILIIPLVICAQGDKKIRGKLEAIGRANVKYQPVTIVPEVCMVTEELQTQQPAFFDQLRVVLKNGYNIINQKMDGEEYGWKKTGSLIVLYSNCPNNTPPIYHKVTDSWNPVFPRFDREAEVKR
ncbi:phosphoribosyltransferase-like protein [Vreelandella lutescens]|uniref:PRTase-CE domain-containing protein n=1 Tax=Vreelandella lutescens TaxID=1602943 RepID=A0ABQ1NGR8_9GAMM|nr:hypothetical protein [Halomonas lutescens]GGC76700.1 hypothetical protein GCM10011382_03220 [Halomonas lutescens]